MGIYDREYIRVGPRSPSGLGNLRFVSFNTWLIIANVAIFLGQSFLPSKTAFIIGGQGVEMDSLTAYGHLSLLTTLQWVEVWRLITFQFLHGNYIHLGFNMLGLWVFGSLVEQYLGFKRYAAFYLMCGICGGLLFLALSLLGQTGLRLPGILVSHPATYLVGASAGVFGVIMACAFIEPRAIIDLGFFIPVQMQWLAYGYVAFALANLIYGGGNAGGDAAHVGGAVAGYFFIRHTHLLHDFFDVFDRTPPPEEENIGLDRILAKIKESGLSSLSDGERRVLRRATLRKMQS